MYGNKKAPQINDLRGLIMADRTGFELFHACFVVSCHAYNLLFFIQQLTFSNTVDHSVHEKLDKKVARDHRNHNPGWTTVFMRL